MPCFQDQLFPAIKNENFAEVKKILSDNQELVNIKKTGGWEVYYPLIEACRTGWSINILNRQTVPKDHPPHICPPSMQNM